MDAACERTSAASTGADVRHHDTPRTETSPKSHNAPREEPDGAARENAVLSWRAKDIRRLIEAKDYKAARNHIGQPASGKREIVRLRLLADIARAEGRYTESVKYLEDAYALDPKNLKTAAEYLEILGIVDNYRMALRVHEELPEKLKSKSRIRFAMYLIYSWIGWPEKAAEVRPLAGLSNVRSNRLKRLVHRIVAPHRLRIENEEEDQLHVQSKNLQILRSICHRSQSLAYEFLGDLDRALIAHIRANRWLSITDYILRFAFPVTAAGAVSLFLVRVPSGGPVGLRVGVGLICSIGIYFLGGKLYDIPASYRDSIALVISFLFFCGTTGAFLLKFAADYGSWIGLTGIGLIAGSTVLALATTVKHIQIVCVSYYRNRVERKYARFMVVSILADLLTEISDVSKRSSLTDSKFSLLRQLESAAHLLEHDVPKQMPSRDQSTDEWLANILREAAESLRHMKKMVLAPAGNSWERLTRMLSQQITALATENLASLLRRSSNREQPRSNRDRLVSAAKLIVVTMLPAVGLFSLSPLIGFNSDALRWARVAVFGWAVLSILFALDPSLRDKVDTARNIVDSARGATDKPDRQKIEELKRVRLS